MIKFLPLPFAVIVSNFAFAGNDYVIINKANRVVSVYSIDTSNPQNSGYVMPDDGRHFDVTGITPTVQPGAVYDPVAKTFTNPSPPPLAQRGRMAVGRLMRLRNQRLAAGFVFKGNGFDSNDAAALNYNSVLTMINDGQPGPFDFNTITGDTVTLDAAQAKQLVYAYVAYKQGVYKAANAHKAAIQASSDPEHYDFTTGWPQSYTDSQSAQRKVVQSPTQKATK